jgi:hypothetical protein
VHTWRYVLAGDFRITHPGDYHVLLQKEVRYAVAAPGESPPPTLRNPSEQVAKKDILLKVRPADPGVLLNIEHSIAAEVMKPWVPSSLPTAAGTSPIDLKALQKAQDDQRAERIRADEANTVLAEGLAEYPAARMEPVFYDWMISDQGYGYGLQALFRLNTPEARRLVAEAADPSRELYLRWRQHVHIADSLPVEKTVQQLLGNWRAMAVNVLARMGDKSYVPLLEKLARDDSAEVRQQAVLGLGLLGGEAELPKLIALAHEAASQEDRQDAIIAMGDTDSLKAVPILIDLFALPNADQPASSNLALMRITHHQVLLDDQHQPATVAAVPALWQEWWVTNEGAAHAFGPFECSEK